MLFNFDHPKNIGTAKIINPNPDQRNAQRNAILRRHRPAIAPAWGVLSEGGIQLFAQHWLELAPKGHGFGHGLSPVPAARFEERCF